MPPGQVALDAVDAHPQLEKRPLARTRKNRLKQAKKSLLELDDGKYRQSNQLARDLIPLLLASTNMAAGELDRRLQTLAISNDPTLSLEEKSRRIQVCLVSSVLAPFSPCFCAGPETLCHQAANQHERGRRGRRGSRGRRLKRRCRLK